MQIGLRVGDERDGREVRPDGLGLGRDPGEQRVALGDGREVKVKYEQTGHYKEVFGEVLGTRIFWALGFYADRMIPVQVTCHKCPADPFHWVGGHAQDVAIDTSVGSIIADVRARGDAAVLEYTGLFDHVKAHSVAALEFSAADLKGALDGLPVDQRDALTFAAKRIRAYHERQQATSWSFSEADGTWITG